MPELSIIIPVYNAAKTIRDCLDSLLHQSFADFELIVVDDGSSDASPTIIDEYAARDARIVPIHKVNAGVSAARNDGLEHASGQWITFVDSDDWVADNFFPTLDNSNDIVFCDYRKIVNGQTTETLDAASLQGLSLSKLVEKNCSESFLRVPWAKFYRRELLEQLKFPVDMKVGEDTYFVFQYISRCKNFAVAPACTYVMRDISQDEHESKYTLPIENAVNSLRLLLTAFEEMHANLDISYRPFCSLIGYFKSVSQHDWATNPRLWYSDSRIKEIYKRVWPDISFIDKIRFLFAFVFNKLKYNI